MTDRSDVAFICATGRLACACRPLPHQTSLVGPRATCAERKATPRSASPQKPGRAVSMPVAVSQKYGHLEYDTSSRHLADGKSSAHCSCSLRVPKRFDQRGLPPVCHRPRNPMHKVKCPPPSNATRSASHRKHNASACEACIRAQHPWNAAPPQRLCSEPLLILTKTNRAQRKNTAKSYSTALGEVLYYVTHLNKLAITVKMQYSIRCTSAAARRASVAANTALSSTIKTHPTR